MIHISVLVKWKRDELWPFHHRVAFVLNGQCLKIGCTCTAYSKSKSQNISGWSYVHLWLLVIDWRVNNIDHSCPISLLVTRNGVFLLTYGKKERNGWAQKKPTPRTKTCAHPQNIMLSTCWNSKSVLYYELLSRGVTITAWHLLPATETSCRHYKKTRLCEVKILHDNARPHSDNLTENTIQELGWEIIPHPPYLPALAPSDFHLFRSLSNNFQVISFPDENVLRTWLLGSYSKPRDFYRRRIEKLLQRWQTVVNSEGEYTVDD